MKFVDIFFLILGTIGLVFGYKIGSAAYWVSAICIIFSAVIFVVSRKKNESINNRDI